MRQAIPAAAVFLPLLLFSAGCGNSNPPTEQHAAALPEAHVDPATAGAITGRVLFEGPAPVMQTIDMSSNPSCVEEHKSRPPVHAQTIVVNPNHTLRNAFVWIKDGLPAAHWAPPVQTVELAQNGCVYEPHVAGIMVGQTLEIVNNDPINHNVHANTKINAPWNIAQAPKAEHKFRKFASPEVLFAMTCSVHPWMNSYIGVVPHPFFAVTGDDGAFRLQGVPPGTYTIEVVQEKLGTKDGTLTLPPGGTASIDFTYGSR